MQEWVLSTLNYKSTVKLITYVFSVWTILSPTKNKNKQNPKPPTQVFQDMPSNDSWGTDKFTTTRSQLISKAGLKPNQKMSTLISKPPMEHSSTT